MKKSEKTKGYLIDPLEGTIKEIEHTKDYKEIYGFIGNGCTIFSCLRNWENGDTLYYDDEGLYHDNIGAIHYDGWRYPVVGRVVVLGSNEEGETIDVKSPIEDIWKGLTFIPKDSWFIENYFKHYQK